MFVFASVLLFGPEAGAITLAADSVLIAWQRKLTPVQTLFNFGNLALSVWLSGQLFFCDAGVQPLFTERGASRRTDASAALSRRPRISWSTAG